LNDNDDNNYNTNLANFEVIAVQSTINQFASVCDDNRAEENIPVVNIINNNQSASTSATAYVENESHAVDDDDIIIEKKERERK